VTFDLPLTALKARWGADLVYMAFVGKDGFAADSGFLFHSSIQPAESRDVVFSAADFQGFQLEGKDSRTCTVSRVSVQRTGEVFTFLFTWNDSTPVMAQPGFKNRFGAEIKTPLDLNSREGQPCDAVELFLDLRPQEAIGRWTANIDANPVGTQRLGVYKETVDGKPVAKVQSLPELPADRVSLTADGETRWVLKIRAPAAGPCVGFTMRVTDNTEFKYASTPLFYLGGCAGAGPEPMRYFQLGGKDEGVLYRIGY